MHKGFSHYDISEAHNRENPSLIKVFLHQIGVFVGLGFLGLIAFCILALATWKASDPSLTHANTNDVANVMGWFGAVFSDLAMQIFGLASLGILLPPLFWSFLLLLHRNINRVIFRLFLWVISAVYFSAAFALMTPIASITYWPLPVGLGGAFGDKILEIAYLFLPSVVIPIRSASCVLLGILFATLGFFTAALSGDIVWRHSRHKRKKAQEVTMSNPVSDLLEDAEDSSVEGRSGVLSMILGAVLHCWYFLRAWFRQIFSINGRSGKKKELFDRVEPVFSEGRIEGDSVQDMTQVPFDERRVSGSRSRFSKGRFILPPLEYLSVAPPTVRDEKLSPNALKLRSNELESVLLDFGVKGRMIDARPGPVVTLYEFEPAAGIKSSRIISLADDIARSMRAISARVAVVPGRNVIGIELPNATRETVYLREILQAQEFFDSKAKLGIALGKTIGGETVVTDLTKMPHLLVAGTTGSGKSVAINTMILSLLYRMTPEQCRLIMVDPKMLELSIYDGIPHLLTPVVTDPKKAVIALKWAVREMEERYNKMSKVGVRNIDGFNACLKEAHSQGKTIKRTVQVGFDRDTGEALYETETLSLHPMPYVVVVIDEMADLMMVAGKDIEGAVQRLAQMARAAGIHVIMATQRPSVDVITGTIKANFPTRISFSVSSKIDSRTILGEQGAEQLLGQGDMLFMMGGGRIQRVHGPFVSDNEVRQVVAHLKSQAQPDYLETVTQDTSDHETDVSSGSPSENDPYSQAVAVVLRDRKASTSYIQRRLGIGYNRAASLIERMEEEGLISSANHAGKREILVPSEEESF